jgi:hypothetical protein
MLRSYTTPDHLMGASKNSSRHVASESDLVTARGNGGRSGRVMGQRGFFDVERRLEAHLAESEESDTAARRILAAPPSKRDTKKGPRRQEAGMVPPLPNSPHGDQLISAKPRDTARFLSDLHMCRRQRIARNADGQPGGKGSRGCAGSCRFHSGCYTARS